jgi:hypothetical protein
MADIVLRDPFDFDMRPNRLSKRWIRGSRQS